MSSSCARRELERRSRSGAPRLCPGLAETDARSRGNGGATSPSASATRRARLGEALTGIQRGVDQRLADLVVRPRKSPAATRRRARANHAAPGAADRGNREEARGGARPLQASIDEHRGLIGTTRDELQRTARELAPQRLGRARAARHGPQGARCRKSRKRCGNASTISRSRSSASRPRRCSGIAAGLGEVEHRQVETVRRSVTRETTRYGRGGRSVVRHHDPHGARGGRPPAAARARPFDRTVRP